MLEHRILVMDDDPHVCSYLTDLLQYFGYKVDCAYTVEGALRQLGTKHYDSLLLDYYMPDGEGAQVLSWVQNKGRTEPVIMMSAMADYDLMIDLVNKGAMDLIPKPVQPSQLKRSLELAISEKHPLAKAVGQ